MDNIQRRLKLIDKQLARPKDFHKQIISTSPLAFCATGLIAGILIQNIFDLPVPIWLILLTLPAAITVLFFIIRRSSTNHQSPITNHKYAAAYLAIVCFLCLGGIRLISFNRPEADDIRNLVADERKLATIRGVIITEPYINKERNWAFARFKFTDPASSFYLKISEVKTTIGWTKTAGTVRVYVDEPVLDLKTGDYVQAYCWLDRFNAPTNPGQFDTARYLARKNVFVAASVQSRDGIEILRSAQNDRWSGIYTKIKRKLRQVTAQALVGELSIEQPSRGLLEALLLGYRRDIDSATYRAFRKTGLLHFISLSGMHLGILVGIIWWLCKTAGLMKPARAVVCIIAIGVFLLIVPPRAPTIRAAIIGFVFCASFFFRRHPNSLNTLSLAAIILLLMRPTGLFEAGWQLSFASVLGLILFCERIHYFLYETITGTSWFEKTPKTRPFFRIISRPGPYLLRLFSTGLTAWLGGAGILLYHFYTINPLTFIWTVIAFPLVASILALGFLKIILSLLLPTAAMVLGVVVTELADSLILIVKLFAHFDISQILIGHVSAVPIILYYGLILFAGFAYFQRPVIKKAVCTAMVLIMIAFLGVTKWQRTYRGNLVFTTLDVGHGQAMLVQLPGRANCLFDAGSLHKSNVGGRIVVPFLSYNGIDRIDCIIISHNDIDHINGIPEIVEGCEVGGVYANDAFFSKTDRWGTAKYLDERLRERGIKKIQSLDELNINSSAKVKILWPTEQVCNDEELGDNDKSAVSLIEFAGRKILLCSDIEKFAQRGLRELFPNLKADIVVVPHHGSTKTLNAAFIKNLQPGTVICSCGRNAYEKQQITNPENNIKSFYTPKDGAVTVWVNANGTIKSRCVNE